MILSVSKITKFFLINMLILLVFSQPNWAKNPALRVNSKNKQTQVLNKNIKTALLHKNGHPLSEPILTFQSSNTLLLSFDDLDDSQVKDYQYTIVHCDANWNESDIFQSDYIDGYPIDNITYYKFSLNTLTPYIHYELEFPNNNIQLTKSGNYLIKIFEEDPALIILQKRFKVLDEKSTVNVEIKPPLKSLDRDFMQEVSFSILLNDIYLNNPSQEIKVVVQQNQRSDNQILNLSPKSVQENRLDYTYNNVSIFEGGNEYRVIDTRSLKHNAINTQEIVQNRTSYNVHLWSDEKRSKSNYRFSEDINGRFLIETYDGRNSVIEGDYSYVNFTLPSSYLVNKDIYLLGAFSESVFDSVNKLIYDPKSEAYKGSLFLKQGYYNYQYLIKDALTNHTSLKSIEGSFFETENEYSIYIYYRPLGSNYDELIGYSSINSRSH